MIYVSTSCLKNPKKLVKVLQEYEKAGIENVELGSVHSYFDIKILKKFEFNFLIHNYFPPPKKPFNFNLSSSDNTIRKKSICLAKKAIELCRQVDSPLYSFHAGFTVDPKKLGKKFTWKNIISRHKAITNFLDSVKEIVDSAQLYGIKLAMEPNVVQKFNLINGKNKLLLFVEYNEIKLFYKYFSSNEIGILLDLGHTSVTSHWLKFDKDKFVNQLKNKVTLVHLSNNNGLYDQHKPLTKNCWQVSKLKLFNKTPIVLETMNLNPNQLLKNLVLAENALN